MNRSRRGPLVGGLILILLGIWFLATQFYPELRLFDLDWPVFLIVAGVLLLIFGILSGAPGMAVPAAIVGGIGVLLYWQNATGNWESWAYAWTLIPGFVGVGILLAGLLGDDLRSSISGGLWMIVISAILFLIFSSFLGGQDLLGPYWPLLLVLLGVWILIQPLLLRRKQSGLESQQKSTDQ